MCPMPLELTLKSTLRRWSPLALDSYYLISVNLIKEMRVSQTPYFLVRINSIILPSSICRLGFATAHNLIHV